MASRLAAAITALRIAELPTSLMERPVNRTDLGNLMQVAAGLGEGDYMDYLAVQVQGHLRLVIAAAALATTLR